MRDSRIHSGRFHYGDRQTAEMEKENYIMKPLILLTGGTGAAANGTPTWALNQNYAENIRRAGGIPGSLQSTTTVLRSTRISLTDFS